MKIPIACTLTPTEAPDRIVAWRAALAKAHTRESTAEGFRLRFAVDAAIAAELGDLAAREVECCAFFTFTLAISAGELLLDVAAPVETHAMIGELFGPAADA